MRHHYIRNGTTTLFGAMNIPDGAVNGRSMYRHRHQLFVRFVNAIEDNGPTGKILDRYAPTSIPRCFKRPAR